MAVTHGSDRIARNRWLLWAAVAGMTARVVAVLDANDRVACADRVSEIANAPDHEAALNALGG